LVPLKATVLMTRSLEPAFCTVTVCAAEGVVTAVAGNVSDVGVTFTTGAGVGPMA
jgi:hypothetical protein